MVMKKLSSAKFAVALFALASFVYAADDFSVLQNDSKAKFVIINAVGVNSSVNKGVCVESELTEKKMRFFIKHAVVSTAFNYQRALILDDCAAEGLVRSSQGKTYRLTIDGATGWGALAGSSKTKYLYCERCEGILEKDFPIE
jgi:hypothetical protein